MAEKITKQNNLMLLSKKEENVVSEKGMRN